MVDMKALSNAYTLRDLKESHNVSLTSSVNSEKQKCQVGVSSDYVLNPIEKHCWFVFRVTYNQLNKVIDYLNSCQIITYFPQTYSLKNINGKKKKVLVPLLPNIIFAYTTREKANSVVKKSMCSCLKYYLDKTKNRELNGYHPPLTVKFSEMINFIKITHLNNEHVLAFSPEKIICKYKSGDKVRVVDGEFKGVVGRVARVAGQQRIVVEIEGLCVIATAYVPSSFIRPI